MVCPGRGISNDNPGSVPDRGWCTADLNSTLMVVKGSNPGSVHSHLCQCGDIQVVAVCGEGQITREKSIIR